MSSPNPFDVPASGFQRVRDGNRTPRYGAIPPLSLVVYRRGRARFPLNPYSWQHAYLTGHFGTPTALLSSDESYSGLSTPLAPRLLSFPADVPEPALLKSLSSHAPEDLDESPVSPQADPSSSTTPKQENTPNVQPFPLSPFNHSATNYATVPAELNHRRFSPYNLRNRDRAVAHQVQVQARPAAMPFDDFILRHASIKAFNPAISAPSHYDLLFDCSSSTGKGITIAQFGRIFKRCMDCDHYVFTPRTNKGHDCNGPAVDVKAFDFRLADYFFVENYLGLTEDDFKDILSVCDTCFRVHLEKWSDWHKCPPGDDPDFVGDDVE